MLKTKLIHRYSTSFRYDFIGGLHYAIEEFYTSKNLESLHRLFVDSSQGFRRNICKSWILRLTYESRASRSVSISRPISCSILSCSCNSLAISPCRLARIFAVSEPSAVQIDRRLSVKSIRIHILSTTRWNL